MDIGGWGMPYDRDLIAERDANIKLRSSVIKWWRVNYIDQALLAKQEEEERLRIEEEEKLQQEADEALKLAAEISARLAREAAEDEALKQAEIAQALAAQDEPVDDDYNATTGSYSGGYGKNVTLDQDGLSQVDSILKEKSSMIDDLFAELGN